MSETVRNTTNAWYDMTVLSRLDQKTKGAIIVVMQRLHPDDLVGHLLAKGGWTHLNLPAIAEIDESIPTGRGRVHHRAIGDLLHPEREPQKILDELKADIGSFAFAAQYQQAPIPAGGNMFDPEWIQRYEGNLGCERGDEIVQSWDTATKPGQLNDFSVGMTWLVRRGAYYLLDVFRARLGFPELRRAIVDRYEHYRPAAVLIEDKASGQSLIQDLVSAGIYATPIEPEGDKVMRAYSATLAFEAGRVAFPRTAPWLGDLEAELRAFPHGRHDDQVDCISQFVIWARDGIDCGPRIRSFDDD
ncbi:phage terminase large subunit [Methylobacterium brachythecii]|nr:phage terminase large subunit [Methylobacterium brachythecii]